MRRLLAILIPVLLLLLTACGGNGGGGNSPTPEPTSQSAGQVAALDSVKVTEGAAGKPPTVDFNKPLNVTQPTIKVVNDGTGARAKAGQTVTVNYVSLNATDGSVLQDGYAVPAESVDLTDTLKTGNAVIYNALVGAKVGSQIAYALPAQPEVPAQGTTPATPAQPGQLLVLKVVTADNPPTPLSQAEVDKLDQAGALPKVTFDAKNVPSIEIPKVAAPTGLVVKVLKPGNGAVVDVANTLTVNYTGWNWSDSVKFDSSYDRGQPASFALNQVIKGWTIGLAGQKVGSTVLLVIPAALAYGAAGQGTAKGDLTFVVEIIDAK